jgi:hypothetical protein
MGVELPATPQKLSPDEEKDALKVFDRLSMAIKTSYLNLLAQIDINDRTERLKLAELYSDWEKAARMGAIARYKELERIIKLPDKDMKNLLDYLKKEWTQQFGDLWDKTKGKGTRLSREEYIAQNLKPLASREDYLRWLVDHTQQIYDSNYTDYWVKLGADAKKMLFRQPLPKNLDPTFGSQTIYLHPGTKTLYQIGLNLRFGIPIGDLSDPSDKNFPFPKPLPEAPK